MNPFNGIQFHASKLYHKGSQVLTGNLVQEVTRQQVKTYAQALSNKLKAEGKNAKIGVAMHYKLSNAWVGGEYSNVGDDVIIYDPSDSVHGRVVQDDTIDACQIYIIKN